VVERFCDRVAIMYLGRIVELARTREIFASQRHPYTRALLSAVPRLAPRPKRTGRLVQGEPPSAACLPAGCVFSSRCPYVEPACATTEPTLEDAAFGHQVACRRWQELGSKAGAA
jgi:oligopeptide/dipeptide ABC transporter ATP-binding protein